MPASGRLAPAGISGRSALVACGQLAGAAAWVSTPLDFDAAGGTALSSLDERRLQLPRSKPAGPCGVPQLVFVPLLQAAVNRRTGARIRVLRQLGIAMIRGNSGADDESSRADDRRIEQAFALDMGIFKFKFSM